MYHSTFITEHRFITRYHSVLITDKYNNMLFLVSDHWGCHRDGTMRKKQKLLDTTIALDSGRVMSLGFSRVHRETGQAIADVTKQHLQELAAVHSTG